MVADHFIYNPF